MAGKRKTALFALGIGDPLLPRLRQIAATNVDAHAWLMESAKHWALAEFIRREERRDEMGYSGPVGLENEIDCQVGHQVAVRTAWRSIGGSPTIFGRSVTDRHAIKVGLLRRDSSPVYIAMWLVGNEDFAGMMEVQDIVELHPDFRLPRWPTSYTVNEPREPNRV